MTEVTLGLGSNLRSRESFLRKAVEKLTQGPNSILKNVRCSQVYSSHALTPEGAPKDWQELSFLNLCVKGLTSLGPRELLTKIKNIEKEIGRKDREKWSPREIDIDILSYGDQLVELDSLKIPHPGLLERPFALLPFRDVNSSWKNPTPGPFFEKTAEEICAEKYSKRTTLPQNTQVEPKLSFPIFGPQLMGILNVTPDSFSDGGRFFDPERSVQRAIEMIQEGASVIDIGAESTRPGAETLSEEEEWQRLETPLKEILSYLKSDSKEVILSVDTRNPSTAERALELGAHWINDVGGLRDPKMVSLAQRSQVPFVFMHSLTLPADRAVHLDLYKSATETVFQWGVQKIRELAEKGVSSDKLIFDPGLGFGKTPLQSLELMRNTQRFQELYREYGVKTLFGHSRKSAFNPFTKKTFENRDLLTIAASCHLAQSGTQFLRVHDIRRHREALEVTSHLKEHF